MIIKVDNSTGNNISCDVYVLYNRKIVTPGSITYFEPNNCNEEIKEIKVVVTEAKKV